MKRTAPLILLLSVFAFVGFGCTKLNLSTKTETKDSSALESQIDRRAVLLEAKQQGLIMDTAEIDQMKNVPAFVQDAKVLKNKDTTSLMESDTKTWPAAALADVTGGSSFGLMHTNFQNGRFTLLATLGGLPAPQNNASYHGWLVKRGTDMKVLDTGMITLNGNKFVNTYVTGEDFSSYDFFVVTLQSNAQSSQPEEHILEGVIR